MTPPADRAARPDLIVGTDGLRRCGWVGTATDYLAYHDDEWGRVARGDDAVFERLSLEAFQSGLSWLTILRRRAGFRTAFDGFSIAAVAGFGPNDRARLLADPGIIRNRAKIEATCHNAGAARALIDSAGSGALDRLVWSHAPDPGRPAPRTLAEVPAKTTASSTLARALKAAGFVFVGPTTAYATMQAIGLVNDHLVGCAYREPISQR